MADDPVDVMVIGAGIAGLAAATRAAKHGLTTICVEEQMFGGLVLNVAELEPAPAGRPAQGPELAAALMEEAAGAGVVYCPDGVVRVGRQGEMLDIETTGEAVVARTIVIASGARQKTLDVPGEREFEHRGVAHCADCDAMFYAGRDVVVIGGGDSAFQEALVLGRHCKTVFIVHRRSELRARRGFVEAVLRQQNIRFVPESVVKEIRGTSEVESVVVQDRHGETREIICSGVFPYVGLRPNIAFLPEDVHLDRCGFLLTDAELKSSLQDMYAIGAVRSGFGGSLDDAFADATRVVDVIHSSRLRR
jgi:thioredoxin reductase (NADPH)